MKFFKKIFIVPITLIGVSLVCCNKVDSAKPIVEDIDGNKYGIITIGDQIWMAENLRTTKFNNGNDIPNIIPNEQWSDINMPAYCWYKNDRSYCERKKYGALYNWSAVESGYLCPSGWHVPSEEEWVEFETFLYNNGYSFDGSQGHKFGKAIASTSGWILSDTEGDIGYNQYRNNHSGFNAYPSGKRNRNDDFIGTFYGEGRFTELWTSTDFGDKEAAYRFLENQGGVFVRGIQNKSEGLAVRCVKDKDWN